MELSLITDRSDRTTRIAELEAEVRRLEAALAAERARASAPADGETKFHVIADSIDQMIWSTTPDGSHDYFNRRWYEYTGVPDGSTDGEGWNGMFHPDDQDRAWAVWRRSLATGEPYHIEYRLRHRSGDYRWVLGRAQPVRGEDGRIVRWFGTCTDIDDLKQTEAALRVSEERLQRAFDAGGIGDYEWDLRTGEIRWSENLMEIVGLPRDTQVTGEAVFQLIHPDDRDRIQAAVERCVEHGEQLDLTYRVSGADGTIRWIGSRGRVVRDADGTALSLVGVNFDVTAARTAEDALQESEAHLAALIQQSAAGVAEADLSGQLISVNDRYCALVGRDRADLLKLRMQDITHPAHLHDNLTLLRKLIETGEPFEIEKRYLRPDGSEVWVSNTVSLIRNQRGEPSSVLAISIDIGARREAEEALRQTQLRLATLTNNLPGVMIYQVVTSRDMSERHYVYVSDNAERVVGVAAAAAMADPAQLMGRISPDNLDHVLAAEREAAAKLETLDIEIGGDTPLGRIRTRIISQPRELPDGTLLWDGILIDVSERRRQQEEAERTAALLGAIGAATPDLIFAKDLELKLLYANEATCRTIGIPPGEAVGASNRDFATNVEEADTMDANDRAVIGSGRTQVVEEVFTSPDGTRRVFRSAKAPMRDARGEVIGLVGVATDITDRVEAEELLRHSEERLREESRTLATLNRTGASLAAQLDVENLVKMVTDAGVELTGAQFGAFFHNVTNEAGESFMLFTLSGAEASQFDFGMPRATAVFHPTFAGEGVIRSNDITKDPRYGLSGPHFGMPAGHLPVRSYLAVSVIGRSGEVMGGLFFGHEEPERFSKRHEQLMTGIAAQAAIAMDNARLFQAAQRELAQRHQAEQALRGLNETLEQRVAEEVERRAEAEEALRQAQKMETLGQLTGGVAHDFNNLLQIVSGNIGLIQRGLPEEAAKLRRAADNAAKGAERAAILTQRLLAFSRRQPLAPKAIQLNRLVGGMSDLLLRTLGETVEVETDLAPDLWTVEIDPHQLENAILNLAINARDAMRGGGQLTIATLNTRVERGFLPHAADVTGEFVTVRVSDTGTGMDQDTVARAFEPFFTTKEVGKGTGLGLSMVYGFVKQSGGHVSIDSAPSRGTTINVYLPRLTGDAVQADDAAGAALPEGGQDETILVCEDDDDVRAYTVEVLRELGYRVLEAHDGPSALRLLDRQESGVDLLFTDVVLPSGMTGAVLAKEAQQLQPGLKVLFTTGYARNAIDHQGRLDPGVQLITKPFSYADLAARVRDLLDGPA